MYYYYYYYNSTQQRNMDADTAQNTSDNDPSYPPDNHHCSDVVYWRGGGVLCIEQVPNIQQKQDNTITKLKHP